VTVHLKKSVLLLVKDEVSLWHPGAQSRLFLCTMTIDDVMPARCGRVMTARLIDPLDVVNNLVEPNLNSAH
jgi:hypothetical protein